MQNDASSISSDSSTAIKWFFCSCPTGHGWTAAAAPRRFNFNQLNRHCPTGSRLATKDILDLDPTLLFAFFFQRDAFAVIRPTFFSYWSKDNNEREANRGGNRQRADVNEHRRVRTTACSEKAPRWRRNPKRPQGLDEKRRTVNFTNWPKCCLYRRPSPLSWTKPQS